jgi:predicted flap endonuclease-1-like 5' DNA nuclease
MAPIAQVKGVTAELAKAFQAAGITDSDAFLAATSTPKQRTEMAAKMKMDVKAVLELANRADLIRIKGVAGVYSDLLENAGVDTVKELAARKAENLHAKMLEINEKMKLTTRPPALSAVTAWVEEAKKLPKFLEY